ncbi:AraC family transcriptional regulator [uncultured Tateyamaria sp.]|uniref:helix-turn-helix domain-containing protein n=1 Tax=uncultured Tateyamaria sp. TaxID=455651 RepID=UPI002632498B|nr:AraC family transcriptional regulator [uncultured Tateyamaria sp.]
MTSLIKRHELVHWMESDGHARVTERPRLNWSRLNTMVCDQGSGSIHGILDGFHLFETVLGGRHEQEVDTNLEPGAPRGLHIGAGSVQYQSPEVDVVIHMEGQQTFQQTMIDDSFFRDAWGAIHRGDPDNFETWSFYGVHDDAMRRCAMALLDEARMPSAGSELYAETLAQQIALLVLRRQNTRAQKAVSHLELSDSELNRVVEHMTETLENPGGLDTLASLVDMDVFAFTRAFKATTGVPPHSYLIELRLIELKEQLINSDQSLADLAYATGFSSQSHMTTLFGKRVGMSPGKYRKQARQ